MNHYFYLQPEERVNIKFKNGRIDENKMEGRAHRVSLRHIGRRKKRLYELAFVKGATE